MEQEYWDTDYIYAFNDGQQWFYFTSPDGIGKVFHQSAQSAKQTTGLTSVVHLLGTPIDW